MTGELVIDVCDLHKEYGTRKVVDGLTLAVLSSDGQTVLASGPAAGAQAGQSEQVTVPVQDRHYLVQVAQRLVSPAQHGQDARPAHQHPPGVRPARRPHRAVKMGHAAGVAESG